jgi:hypothetical protein
MHVNWRINFEDLGEYTTPVTIILIKWIYSVCTRRR